MLLVVDALNRHRFEDILEEMFRLRARVFGGRLGWEVSVADGMERDQFDALDPAYAIGIDDEGNVVSCVRALQTTGPHMLSDVFADILGGEPPLRDPLVWESTRFCVDTTRLTAAGGMQGVSRATCELMIASLETALEAGISDIVTVIDPVMNRVLKRSGNAPYDYLGKTVPMGKVPAMAALLDVTPERIKAIRDFAGIDYNVFLTEDEARDRFARRGAEVAPLLAAGQPMDKLQTYCLEQLSAASTEEERAKAIELMDALTAYARAH
ncbi:MAG: autoinducer synthase [Roseivivax sp.]|nr:autoinducer synthase [Roseivivax sp.]